MASTGPAALVAFVCLCLGAIKFADALRCLQCDNDGVEDITQCNTIAKCADNEECYTEVQIQGDRLKYLAGCGFKGRCLGARANPIGRRDDNLLCRQCCHDENFCNSHLCDANTNLKDNYTLCLGGITSSPDTSDLIEFCDPAHDCFSQVHFEGSSFQYHLGCNRGVTCGDVKPIQRDLILCGACCRGNFCNLNLCLRDQGTTTIPTTQQHTKVTIKQQPTNPPATTASPLHHASNIHHTNPPHSTRGQGTGGIHHTSSPHNSGDHGTNDNHLTSLPHNTGHQDHTSPSPVPVTVKQTNPPQPSPSSAATTHISSSADHTSPSADPVTDVQTNTGHPSPSSDHTSPSTDPVTDVQTNAGHPSPSYQSSPSPDPVTAVLTNAPQPSPSPAATTQPSSSAQSTTPKVVTATTKAATFSTSTSAMSTTPPHAPVLCEMCDSKYECVASPKMEYCPPAQPFCMNTITQHFDGSWELRKGCASDYDCRTKWWSGSSDQDSCTSFNPLVGAVEEIECYICCTANNCNEHVALPEKSLYTLDSRRR